MQTIANIDHYIGGEPRPPAENGRIENKNPATGETLGLLASGTAKDVDRAVAAAKKAAPGWAATPVSERADLLEAVAKAIEKRARQLAELETLDTGKALWLSKTIDIPRAIANFRFFAGAARHDHTECHPMPEALNYTQRRPLGVVGLITPWNLPLYLLTWKVAPALAMGNTVVAKPSELTPLTATELARIFVEVGAPKGIFNVVHGLGQNVGAALTAHPDVAGVSFTGGTATGAKVAASAAPLFKKLSLELGGKNATMVFADCDLEATVDGVLRASFANQGQVCLCGSRILVERSIADEFTARFVDKARAMKVGAPLEADTRVGSLVSQAHRDKVEGYISLAKQEGGEILCGGERPQLPEPYDEGAFLQPTVIGGLDPGCRTATEEIFGPVVTIHPFDGDAEAVKIANGVRYGLSASVWTSDLKRAHRVSEALDVGMVWVNTWLLRDLRVPFGGVKDSGVGREGGRYSLEFFSESKNICVHLGPRPSWS